MKPWIWLRIAAALQLLGTIGHTLATASTAPMRGAGEQAVFDAMRSFRFVLMGSVRSHWDLYRGYQLSTTVNFLMLVALLWLLGSLSRSEPRQSRPLVLVILIAQAATVVLSWTFFFAAPGIVGSLIVLSLAMASLGLYGAAGSGSMSALE